MFCCTVDDCSNTGTVANVNNLDMLHFRRLDYFVISERLKYAICDCVIRDDVLGSDHCPINLLMQL